MKELYYVIVDLDTLSYQREGNPVDLKNADKFDTLKEAEEELKTYNDEFNGAIYQISEYKTIGHQLIK